MHNVLGDAQFIAFLLEITSKTVQNPHHDQDMIKL